MHCPSCNSENPDDTKFCGYCRSPLNSRCSNCGAENPPQFKFCGECGSLICAGTEASRGSPFAQTTAVIHDTDHSALDTSDALAGERRLGLREGRPRTLLPFVGYRAIPILVAALRTHDAQFNRTERRVDDTD
jgi:hypothetical protein